MIIQEVLKGISRINESDVNRIAAIDMDTIEK